VLITCAKNRESESIREIYNLLNEVVNITTPCLITKSLLLQYADVLYPNQPEQTTTNSASAGDSLEQEIAALKEKQDKGEAQRFYCLETNVKGVVLVKFTDERISPVPFLNHIFNDLVQTKVQKTKHVSPRPH